MALRLYPTDSRVGQSLNEPDQIFEKDLELNHLPSGHLDNDVVRSLSWRDITVVVKDRVTKAPRSLITSANGYVQAGQMVALMGPSGSGKTTLLDVLSHRITNASEISGDVLVNGRPIDRAALRQVSCYVEQEDHLIGSLTVRETIDFAARLSLPSNISKMERLRRVDDLLQSFGMQQQANTLVGTPIRKGISGGQKRRLSVASQLVTSPKVLFLDEPTSGLDSAASFEVMNFIKNLAVRHRLIVVASIHQPSTKTFNVFNQLMLLSGGRPCYFGPTADVHGYFSNIGHPVPVHMNPAEYFLDLINIDFAQDKTEALQELKKIQDAWSVSDEAKTISAKHLATANNNGEAEKDAQTSPSLDNRSKIILPVTLLHRSFIKSYRDVIAYGIRIAMYTGLAIMMGTVWLRLRNNQSSIISFINAIFFGGAFMSFMAVAYIPAIIEDLQTFRKERANGLYGLLPFIIANTVIGIPYLFAISVIFSVIAYWLGNFNPTAKAFFTWVMWLFLDLLAAEGLVVLVTSIVPIFVVALAVVAFANGMWMCVDGFLVPMGTLNPFWKYVFHYIDYQAYVFQGMMVNQFKDTNYTCESVKGGGYTCMYPSDLESEGMIRRTAVLSTYKISTDKTGEWVGIMIAIIVVYRLFGYLALRLKK